VWLWAWINHSCPTLFSTATCFLLKSSEKNHSIYAFFLPSYIGFLLNSKDPLSIQITTLVYAKQWFWYLFFFSRFSIKLFAQEANSRPVLFPLLYKIMFRSFTESILLLNNVNTSNITRE
jgi:hypothetical protein